MVAVEGADGAKGLVDGGACELALSLKMEEEVEDLIAAQSGKVLVWIVLGEPSDPMEVGLGGAFAQSFELDKAGIFLIPLAGSDDVMVLVFLP